MTRPFPLLRRLVPALLLTLALATPALAGGPAPGEVIVDVKCTNRSTGQYCGTYSRHGTIRENGDLGNFGSKDEVLKDCVRYYANSVCPKEQMRYSIDFWRGLSHYSQTYPE
ncbi:MAG: hypothetical protein H0S85_15330 [Desulfovibrionaceae bacterium]|jgi:hypothetical protein|nr:hypothetical protein [Desulfovibrionaceae bacterium]